MRPRGPAWGEDPCRHALVAIGSTCACPSRPHWTWTDVVTPARAWARSRSGDGRRAGGEAGGCRYGATAMQGWRVKMEDAHVARLGLGTGSAEDEEEEHGGSDSDGGSLALFGVFDGHVSERAEWNGWVHTCMRFVRRPLG